MLLGEHAVLKGYPAVVCAINNRITVELIPQADRHITLTSALGEFQTSLDKLVINPPFQFVIAAIKLYEEKLTQGFHLKIQADFASHLGLGSSAAVTVACIAVLREFANLGVLPMKVLSEGLTVLKTVQGVGSGADLAASIFGGLIRYQIDPLKVTPLIPLPYIGLFYSGSKMLTAAVIKHIEQQFRHRNTELINIYQAIAVCAEEGIVAIKEANWQLLGQIFNRQQVAMEKLGVCNQALQQLINKIIQQKAIFGVKISGSGLGDCVVAIGNQGAFSHIDEQNYIPVDITTKGLKCEETRLC